MLFISLGGAVLGSFVRGCWPDGLNDCHESNPRWLRFLLAFGGSGLAAALLLWFFFLVSREKSPAMAHFAVLGMSAAIGWMCADRYMLRAAMAKEKERADGLDVLLERELRKTPAERAREAAETKALLDAIERVSRRGSPQGGDMSAYIEALFEEMSRGAEVVAKAEPREEPAEPIPVPQKRITGHGHDVDASRLNGIWGSAARKPLAQGFQGAYDLDSVAKNIGSDWGPPTL